MGKVLYHIRTDLGATFVKHPNGADVPPDELKIIIDNLTEIYQAMITTQLSQIDIKNRLYAHVMKPIMDQCKVFYPCNLPYINWMPGNPNRPHKAKRHCGVYFASHPDKQGLLKVGCSIDTYKRMKGLYHEYGKKPLTVVAFIENADCEEVESYIHSQLGRGYHQDEWFRDTSALHWLKGFAS